MKTFGMKALSGTIAIFLFAASAMAQQPVWEELYFRSSDLARQGDYPAALIAARQALDLATKEYGPYHKNVVASLAAISSLCRSRGDLKAAEHFLKKALAIRAMLIGSDAINNDYLDIYSSLVDLTDLYRSQKKYDEAISALLQAISLETKAFGEDSPEILKDLSALAVLYGLRGNLDEQERVYKRILKIEDARMADDRSPGFVDAMTGLSNLYISAGRYDDAEILLKRIITEKEDLDGPQAAALPRYLSSLALIKVTQGRLTEAEQLARRALEIDERVLAATDPELTKDLSNLATIYTHELKFKDAAITYRRALEIAEERFGTSSDITIAILENMAAMFEQSGSINKAQKVKETIAQRSSNAGAGAGVDRGIVIQ